MKVIVLLGLCGVSVLALAEPSSQPSKEKAPAEKVVYTKHELKGELRRPEAIYILQRATITQPEVEQKQSFIKKSVESVDKGKEF